MELTLEGLWSLLNEGGATALLALWFFLGMREVWVWGVVYKRALADKEAAQTESTKWQDLAWKEAHLMERATRKR